MEEESKKKFPYLELAGVLVASALITFGIFWIWHMVEIQKLKGEHRRENDNVREEVRMLLDHLNTLGGTSTKNTI